MSPIFASLAQSTAPISSASCNDWSAFAPVIPFSVMMIVAGWILVAMFKSTSR